MVVAGRGERGWLVEGGEGVGEGGNSCSGSEGYGGEGVEGFVGEVGFEGGEGVGGILDGQCRAPQGIEAVESEELG